MKAKNLCFLLFKDVVVPNKIKFELIMDVTSLRNQRQSIISASDLVIYDEILVACENNLYRATYILAWIAIVESLKR